MSAPGRVRRVLLGPAMPFALALAIWAVPVPAGLTPQAWHLFAIFAAAIASVIAGALPLLTSAVLAGAAAVLSGTLPPAKAFAGFSNGSVLLVVVAFVVARSVVKSGLGRRLSLLVVSAFGRSTLGLAYSVFLTDALIAPAFPSNTARGGVLYPVVLSLAEGVGSRPDDPGRRRTGGFLMFCGMASLSVSSALWLTATSANPIGAQIAERLGIRITFGSWLLAACVPALAAIAALPPILAWLHPPEQKATPDALTAARKALGEMGPLCRDEKLVAVAFVLMVAGWVLGPGLKLDGTAVAFAGLGGLLAARVLTLDDVAQEGGTLVTFLWLAVLFAMSAQLNELGFMGYMGERLARGLSGLPWPAAFVALAALYVLMHYLFVSQSAQVLALFGVFTEVGVRSGVPAPLMAYTLLFASSYFSTITPQGGTQNVIFVGSGYLTQRELYRLGALTTAICLVIFLAVGTPWLLLVAR
ncbi:MAG TPA: DASS family sodium-coupled anion symporter [Anaeromyxobacteraceae bacterium]|nr:DASS family sodium-coupled anion symporter [Anaeromyxobacteraceae bacterium]